MIYYPIIGALALATGTIIEKTILIKRKVNIKLYQTAGFLAIVLVMLPFVYFFWKMTPEAFELKNLLIFSLVIVFSIAANLFAFYSLKWEKVTNLTPARILEPLFIILLAIGFSYVFGEQLYERNLKIIVPAIIAGVAIALPHIKRNHLILNKYFIAAIIGSFFFALELVITRLILDFYSPISFYFLRCSAIFLISFALFRQKFSNLNTKVRFEILLVGIIWFVYRIVVYYGYLNFGVIFTTLMIMLGPIFVYLLAWKFLKEKLNWKNIVSALVIVGCVLYGILG